MIVKVLLLAIWVFIGIYNLRQEQIKKYDYALVWLMLLMWLFKDLAYAM